MVSFGFSFDSSCFSCCYLVVRLRLFGFKQVAGCSLLDSKLAARYSFLGFELVVEYFLLNSRLETTCFFPNSKLEASQVLPSFELVARLRFLMPHQAILATLLH